MALVRKAPVLLVVVDKPPGVDRRTGRLAEHQVGAGTRWMQCIAGSLLAEVGSYS